MKAYTDNKTVYISDFIKQNRSKRRVKQLKVQLLIVYVLYKCTGQTNETSFNANTTIKSEEAIV